MFARPSPDQQRARRQAEKAANLSALAAPSRAIRTGIRSRCDAAAAPIPKDNLLQHLGYMAAVRLMACAHCGLPGPSQFCHSDEGKGTGIKSDCRLGWPGCPACHVKVGTTRIYPKQERRELEAYMAKNTRAALLAAGQWPKNLELWTDDACS